MPAWNRQLALAVGGDAYQGIALWSGAQYWSRVVVPYAYDLWYKQIRLLMPNNGVSRDAVLKVADARARYADGRTGRHCRPKIETLMRCTGLSERTVQRASLALRLLGCATEILRGRQRTKRERLASWAMGDRGRGWASVWALHPPRAAVDNSRGVDGLWRPVHHQLSPHPRRGSISVDFVSFRRSSPTHGYPQHPPDQVAAGQGPPINGGASRPATTRTGSGGVRGAVVAEKGRQLAVQWLAQGRTPAWAGRHTPRGWARVLAGPAAHGWTADDLNLLLHEWVHVGGHWMPETPYKPIGLLGAALRWHGQLDDPPAAAQRARDAAELAERRAQHAAELAERKTVGAAAATADARAAAKKYFADFRQGQRRGGRA